MYSMWHHFDCDLVTPCVHAVHFITNDDHRSTVPPTIACSFICKNNLLFGFGLAIAKPIDCLCFLSHDLD